jgi:hypothetical protein
MKEDLEMTEEFVMSEKSRLPKARSEEQDTTLVLVL